MKAVNGLMSIHVVCYLVKERLLHCFKCLSNGIFMTQSIFYFEFDHFNAEARSRETYINKLSYEKQKKISKRKVNLYIISKLCNAMS